MKKQNTKTPRRMTRTLAMSSLVALAATTMLATAPAHATTKHYSQMTAWDQNHERSRMNDAKSRCDVETLHQLVSNGVPATQTSTCPTFIRRCTNPGRRVEVLRLVLSAGANPNVRCASTLGADTPLHQAAVMGDTSAARVLLAAGADPNATNELRGTPLHFAAGYRQDRRRQSGFTTVTGDLNTVMALLAAGADPNAASHHGITPLHAAEQDVRIAKALLDAGADPNRRALESEAYAKRRQKYSGVAKPGSGFTPLLAWMRAHTLGGNRDQHGRDTTAKGVQELAREIEELAKDLEELRVKGTPIELIRLLIDRGADVNARGTRGEHALVGWFRGAEIAQALLAAGADVNAQDDHGRTPLHAGSAEAARIYLEAGARPNARDNEGRTALFTIPGDPTTRIERLTTLLAGGVDPHLRDRHGRTPLFEAFPTGKNKLGKPYFDTMRAAGIDVNAQDNRGRTALQHQLARGFEQNERRRLATERDFRRFLILLEHGADPNVADENGNTTLHLTARWCPRYDFLGALLEHGADVNGLNKDGFRYCLSMTFPLYTIDPAIPSV